MDINDFKKLRREIESNIKWNEENILDMEQKLGGLYHTIQTILSNERIEYENAVTRRDSLYGKLYKDFKYNSEHQWDSKSEIESQIKSDSKYVELSLKMNQSVAILEYLENTLKNLSNINFQIKDFINWKKFKAGVNF